MKTLVLFLLISLYSTSSLFAQGKNNELYDYNKWIHFGFSVGLNFADFKYEYSDNYWKNDTLLDVNSTTYPGLSLGGIANLHMGEHFDLRMIPTLILTQRTLNYTFTNGITQSKDIESVMIMFPLNLKFKSIRHNNTRLYVLGGVNYGYDMASQAEAEKNPFNPFVAVIPQNIKYELGFGFDFYFPYFKFSPEIKFSRGLNNVISPDPGSVYTESFSSFQSNFLFISFHFE